MKINLVIEADTPEELRAACRQIAEGDPHSAIATPLPDYQKPTSLATGESDDPYGDGNGPVDEAVQQAEHNAPERDAVGLPWDERIHAGSRALNVDGTWRKRRGVDDETVAAVEAELRGVNAAAPVPVAEPTGQPEAEAPNPEPDVTPSEPTLQPAAERTYTAKDVMQIIGSAMSSGSCEPTYITELCQEAGVEQIVDIFNNEVALAAIVTKLRADEVISDV